MMICKYLEKSWKDCWWESEEEKEHEPLAGEQMAEEN